jgi:hypothetical protein
VRRPSALTNVAGRHAADERRARVKANLEATSPMDPEEIEEIVPEVSEEVPEISAEMARDTHNLPPLPDYSASGSPDLRSSGEENTARAEGSLRSSMADSEGTVDSELERELAAVEAEVEAARLEADAAEEVLKSDRSEQEALREANEAEESAVESGKSQDPEGLSMALKLAQLRAEVVEVAGSQTAEEAEAAEAAEAAKAEAKEKALADEVERQGELRLAERHDQTALAHSSPLQRPTRLLKAAPRAREEYPSRLGAEERLR